MAGLLKRWLADLFEGPAHWAERMIDADERESQRRPRKPARR